MGKSAAGALSLVAMIVVVVGLDVLFFPGPRLGAARGQRRHRPRVRGVLLQVSCGTRRPRSGSPRRRACRVSPSQLSGSTITASPSSSAATEAAFDVSRAFAADAATSPQAAGRTSPRGSQTGCRARSPSRSHSVDAARSRGSGRAAVLEPTRSLPRSARCGSCDLDVRSRRSRASAAVSVRDPSSGVARASSIADGPPWSSVRHPIGGVDVPEGEVGAVDEHRLERASALVGDAPHSAPGEHDGVAPRAVVGRGQRPAPSRARRAPARSRAGRGPARPRARPRPLTSSPSAARPQRRLAPGPAAQSSQCTTRDRRAGSLERRARPRRRRSRRPGLRAAPPST